MMWILVWLQLVSNQGVDYYQIGTYARLEDCQAAMAKAKVMINHTSETLACLEVDTRQ
jgi:hypothetical protein